MNFLKFSELLLIIDFSSVITKIAHISTCIVAVIIFIIMIVLSFIMIITVSLFLPSVLLSVSIQLFLWWLLSLFFRKMQITTSVKHRLSHNKLNPSHCLTQNWWTMKSHGPICLVLRPCKCQWTIVNRTPVMVYMPYVLVRGITAQG
jgi:hypothetical protein